MKLERGQIVANTAALTLVQLLPRLSGLVMVPLVAWTLGSEQLGSYQLAHLIVSYAALLILAGLGPLAVREVAAHPERGLDVFAEVLVARLLLVGPALLGVLALLFGLGYPPVLIVVGVILGVSVFSFALHDTADLVFQAHERAYLTALLTLLGQGLYLLLGLASLGAGAGIVGLAAAYAAAMAVRSVATLALLVARYGRVRWQLNLRRQRRLLGAGLPFFVHGFGAHLVNRIDALLLSVLLPLEVVGWYLAAYLFVDVALYLPGAFGQALYPRLARAAPEAEFGDLTCRALRLLMLVVLPLPGWVALLAPALIGLFYGAAFAPAVQLLQVLIWSLPLVAYSVVVGRAVFARGGQVVLMKVQLVGLAANVAANLLLIPRLGALGAALSTVGTFGLIALLQLWQARRFGCTASLLVCARFLAPTAASWLTIWLLLPAWPWPLALLAGLVVYAIGVVGGAVRGGWAGLVREVGELGQLSPRPLAQRR